MRRRLAARWCARARAEAGRSSSGARLLCPRAGACEQGRAGAPRLDRMRMRCGIWHGGGWWAWGRSECGRAPAPRTACWWSGRVGWCCQRGIRRRSQRGVRSALRPGRVAAWRGLSRLGTAAVERGPAERPCGRAIGDWRGGRTRAAARARALAIATRAGQRTVTRRPAVPARRGPTTNQGDLNCAVCVCVGCEASAHSKSGG